MKIEEEEHFNLIRKISKNSNLSQRGLANELGVSLGKVNYCLKSLKKKGLVKIQNIQRSKDKIKYLYVLTPKGISEKSKITLKFMKRKMQEYDELKKEIKN
jgi:EPS-associated MarR family transcriptional regulator